MTLVSIPLTDSRWLGTTWSIVAGRAVNTPTLGAELVVNGNMETGDPPNNWVAAGGSILTQVADERTGGAGLFSLNGARDAVSNVAFQNIIMPAMSWFRLSGWIKNISAVSGSINYFSLISATTSSSNAAWTSVLASGLANTTTISISMSGVAGNEGRFDDISCNKITTSTLLRSIAFGTQYFSTIKAAWTIGMGLQAGVFSNLDSIAAPANYVVGFITRGGNAVLGKVVGGVYTILVNVATAYAADRVIEIRRPSGNTYSLWYNGVQRGIDQVINDAGIVNNTIHGAFSTDAANSEFDFWIDEIPQNQQSFPRRVILPRAMLRRVENGL